MKFRPCIDLRNGKVTQIVGSTLSIDQDTSSSEAVTNFESERSSAFYAELYKKDQLKGGHVIMLGPGNQDAALCALKTYPGGLQIGGGITPTNAKAYLEAGASHIIVTSYIFVDGKLDMDRLKELVQVAGKKRIVLDLSCRRKPNEDTGLYYVVTNKWQTFTDFPLTKENMEELAAHCDEFLVHGVDVEGKQQGIENDLIEQLGEWSSIPVTYAGGVRSIEDLQLVQALGKGKVDATIGSALDIFGGSLQYSSVLSYFRDLENVSQ